MAKKKASSKAASTTAANIGFEAKLWLAADKMRNNMDAAEYKHVVLGLIFLKYISDAFEEMHQKLIAGEGQYEGADPEHPDEYRAENVFWVPPEARWQHLQDNAKQPTIGKLIDDAMVAIERDNPRLKGVLPKDYARPALDKQRVGELIDLIGTIGLGDAVNRSKDILGRVYEYFLTQFASAEGKNGGQFYTPRCIVRVLVEMLAPYKGRVYDPCCGSAGMFVQSEKFVEEHGGKIGGFVLANGSMSSSQSDEGDIRKAMIEDDLVDCMVALPGQLFYSTQIPVCLWFLTRDKSGKNLRGVKQKKPRNRAGQTLFINARKLGVLIDRVHRELTDDEIKRLEETYHHWQLGEGYADIPGFCKSATKEEIAAHGHVLTPSRYVGAEAVEDDGDPFEEKMPRLVAELHRQFAESAKLEQAIKANLKGLGFDGPA